MHMVKVGIDIGGTTIKSALISSSGKIIKRHETQTNAQKGTKSLIKNIFSSIENVKEGEILGIGVGSPGPMDIKKGIITSPVNLPFRNTPLKKIIWKKFKIPVYLDNDANCFALAEAIFGQGKDYKSVIGITLGTGFGGGLIIDKKVYYGRGNAAELGHMSIEHNGLRGKSGNDGSIEEYVSSRGITRMFDGKSEAKDIHALAINGSKKALETYKKMGYYLGTAITNITYAFDPNIIVIGGKISNSWAFFHKSMEEEIKKRYFAKPPKVVRSKLKDAGILGAAALFGNA